MKGPVSSSQLVSPSWEVLLLWDSSLSGSDAFKCSAWRRTTMDVPALPYGALEQRGSPHRSGHQLLARQLPGPGVVGGWGSIDTKQTESPSRLFRLGALPGISALEAVIRTLSLGRAPANGYPLSEGTDKIEVEVPLGEPRS